MKLALYSINIVGLFLVALHILMIIIGFRTYSEVPQYGIHNQISEFPFNYIRLLTTFVTIVFCLNFVCSLVVVIINFEKIHLERKLVLLQLLILIYFILFRIIGTKTFFWIYD